MTMNKALHPRDDKNSLLVSRKQGGRGLASIEDIVNASIRRLKDYIKKSKVGLIKVTRNSTDNIINNKTLQVGNRNIKKNNFMDI